MILPVIALLLFFNSTFQIKAEPVNLTNIVQTDNEIPVVQQNNKAPTVQPDNKTAVVIHVKETNSDQQKPSPTQEKPPVFTHVEDPPSFPGGEDALLKWLGENVQYPKAASENGIQGVVIIRFIVTPDGSISDVTVMKSLDPSCDNESVRAIKTMPKWTPGKQNGKAVYVYYSIPVRFKLEPNDTANSSSLIDNLSQRLQNTQNNVIIEIDGKVVSNEVFNKIDPKTIESLKINNNRLIVKTKK